MFLTAQAVFAADLPFWKTKDKVFERVKNGEIIVAVKTKDVKEAGKAKHHMIIQGGGHVKVPPEFVYRKALEFDELGKVSGYIKSAKFDPKTELLELTVGAFGFEGRMKLLIKARPDGDPRQIDFLVTKGGMQGLTGTFTFSDLGVKGSEVGIQSDFHYDTFPAPQVFMEFGLEVVFQRMAARLRAHVEKEFKGKTGA